MRFSCRAQTNSTIDQHAAAFAVKFNATLSRFNEQKGTRNLSDKWAPIKTNEQQSIVSINFCIGPGIYNNVHPCQFIFHLHKTFSKHKKRQHRTGDIVSTKTHPPNSYVRSGFLRQWPFVSDPIVQKSVEDWRQLSDDKTIANDLSSFFFFGSLQIGFRILSSSLAVWQMFWMKLLKYWAAVGHPLPIQGILQLGWVVDGGKGVVRCEVVASVCY